MGKLVINENEIRKTISTMKETDQLFEVRIVLDERTTYSGYFKDVESLLVELRRVPVAEGNVYLLLNRLDELCWSRKQGGVFLKNVKDATKDADIKGYKWLLIDLDPERAKGVSASDEEVALAKQKAKEVFAFLKSQGFEDPVVGFSGNGYHLLYRVNIKTEAKEKIKKFLAVLDVLFSDERIKVDTVNFNPARVCKLYGTLAMKGQNTEERPHRISKIIYTPTQINATKLVYIENINKIVPEEPEVRRYNSYNPREFNLDNWLTDVAKIGFKKTQTGSATKYILEKCPFDDNHKGKDACLFVSPNGAIGFHCFHNSCADKKWQDVRKLFEPDAYEKKQKQTDDLLYGRFGENKVKKVVSPIPEGSKTFLNAAEIFKLEEPEEQFIPSGIYWIDRKMRGLKKTGVSVVSGSRGAAKSTLLTQLCANVADAGYKVAMYSGEMKNKNLMRWMNLQIAGKTFSEPTQYENFFVVSEENQKIIAEWLGDNFWLYDNQYGNEFTSVLEQVEKIIEEKQIDLVVLDNLMAFDIANLGKDKWDAQKEFVWQIHELALRSNTHVIFVAHPRKPNGFLRLDDISGTADIANAVDNAFIVHRVNEDFKSLAGRYLTGKTKEIIFDATNCIEIAKDRDGGNQDVFIPLYYENESKRLLNERGEVKFYKCKLIQSDPF